MRRALACSLSVLFLLPASAAADHVTASPQVSARLGDRISDNSWGVIVDWSINCSGPAPGNANYTGNLNLDDVDTGEVIYMGGTSSASGSDVAPVGRRAQPRRMRPRIKASCFDGGIGNHGSDTIEVTGNVVTVPALGDENGDGLPDGGGGGTPPPPGGGTPPPGGGQTPAGPCAVRRAGTPRGDTLTGTSAGDLILGLAGNDVLRGRGGDDCLSGGPGRDRLLGGPGADRLDGGRGADRLDGGAGTNRYDAGPGNDVVRARNGRRELVACGAGRDRARVDRRDRVRRCERVTRG
jgi:Ca2+-binding RTX toxin-like protein